MGTHLAAWFELVDQAALAAINNVVDDILTRTSAERFLVPADYNRIHAMAALGVNITRAQFVTPSLGVRRQSLEVVPRVEGDDAFTLTMMEVCRPMRPITLRATEEIEFQSAEDGAGATAMYGLVWLGPEALPAMAAGEIRQIRATGTTTLVANAWSTVSITPDVTLEPGTYQLVGFLPNSATAIAARALITGQNYRPGMPAVEGAEDVAMNFDPAVINSLMYYNMGVFTHITLPQFQFLASAADTAERVILWVIRTGD